MLGENYAEVRYEDLLERPTAEVGRLLRFLGADAEQGCRAAVRGGCKLRELDEGPREGPGGVDVFPAQGRRGDWENVFTERDKEVFKEEAGDLLIELGYEKDGDW